MAGKWWDTALLAERGCTLDIIVWCPHGPDDGCDCRKPQPGLYHRIASETGFPLEDAVVIGDSRRDIEAAVQVGARPVLVLTGKGRDTRDSGNLPDDTLVFADLASAADAVIAGAV